jgi:hypothetical protein
MNFSVLNILSKLSITKVYLTVIQLQRWIINFFICFEWKFTSDILVHGTCCKSAVLRTIRSFLLASAKAKDSSTLLGSMKSRSSSTSFVLDCVLSTDAVSLLALGFLLYFANISSVVSAVWMTYKVCY